MGDLTFIIPVRIDSIERLVNLRLVADYITINMPEVFLFILEADEKRHLTDFKNNGRVRYEFVKDADPVFFRTHYLNRMTTFATTSRLAIWDTDLLISCRQIREACTLLETGAVDFVFPYDGRMLRVETIFKDIYKQTKDFALLDHYSTVMSSMFGKNSYGGAFMVDRAKYMATGGENENIYGWGPEDLERVKRWEILGHSIVRVEGPAYHLCHPILQNSRDYNEQIGCRNNRELFRVCGMNEEELCREVSAWQLERTIIKNIRS